MHLGNGCWFRAPQRWRHHAFHLKIVKLCSQRVACKKQLNFCLIVQVNVCVDKKQNKTKTRIDGDGKSWTANYWSALSFVPSHESSPIVFIQKSWAGFLVVKEIGEDFKTPRGAGRKKSIIYCLTLFLWIELHVQKVNECASHHAHMPVPIVDSGKSLVKPDCSVAKLSGWMALVIKLCIGLIYWFCYVFVVSDCFPLRYNFWHWTTFKCNGMKTTRQVNSIISIWGPQMCCPKLLQ